MKKVLVTMIVVMMSAFIASAGTLQCGASIETVKDSGQFNKVLFYDTAVTGLSAMVFVLPDGTVLKTSKDVKPEMWSKIVKGTLAISFNLEDKDSTKRGTISISKVRQSPTQNSEQNILEDSVLAQSMDSHKVILLAHGVFAYCNEF